MRFYQRLFVTLQTIGDLVHGLRRLDMTLFFLLGGVGV